MPSESEYWERVERDARDIEHHLEDIVRVVKNPRERLKYEDWIDQLREIRRHAHQNADDIAVSPVEPRESSLHLAEGLHTEEPHLIGVGKHQDPINWEKHAWWFEAEGTKPKLKYEPIDTVTQDVARADIVETLCDELRELGFTTYLTTYKPRKRVCRIHRLEEKICFLERTKPHYLSKQTKRWADEYLRLLKTRERETRPRIPFTCQQ